MVSISCRLTCSATDCTPHPGRAGRRPPVESRSESCESIRCCSLILQALNSPLLVVRDVRNAESGHKDRLGRCGHKEPIQGKHDPGQPLRVNSSVRIWSLELTVCGTMTFGVST